MNNIVKSKIVYSNQDLSEKNTEVIHFNDKLILRWTNLRWLITCLHYFLVYFLRSQDEIFDVLRSQVAEDEVLKLKELLGLMTETELRHIDYLIYLMKIYTTARQNLFQSILEILSEDETTYKELLSNFSWRGSDRHFVVCFNKVVNETFSFKSWLIVARRYRSLKQNKQNSIPILFFTSD